MGGGGGWDISHRQDAGVGDVTIPISQVFGGAGSPFREPAIDPSIILAALAVVAVVYLLKR